jgi:hypothetical protein
MSLAPTYCSTVRIAMKLLLTSIALACVFAAQGQITGFVCSELTQYTNTNPNDSIYYYPQNELGSLLATGSSGVAPYTFSWNYFNLTAGAWSPYFSEVAASSSLIENLQPGAYNVVITDANGTTVGCDNAWIVQYLIGEGGGGGLTVDLFPIEPSCTQIVLQGVIDINPPWGTGGFTTGYSNLPPNPMFVDASTAINVCFTGTHTWVSDIAFYLVGPASCGTLSQPRCYWSRQCVQFRKQYLQPLF